MPERIVSAAIGIALLAFLVGCGGGSDTSSTRTGGDEELTKSEIVARGDAICKDANDEFAQLQQNPPTTQEETATFTQNLISLQEDERDMLRALDAPASVEPALDRYLAALEQNIATLKQGLEAVRNDDVSGYADAQAKTVKDQLKRLQLARAVGFKECSRPAGTAPGSAG
jgi:chromosome segregation ATPase